MAKLNEYMRIGVYIAKVNKDGYVVELYRIDSPALTYKPTVKLTVTAAKMRESRGKLEAVLS